MELSSTNQSIMNNIIWFKYHDCSCNKYWAIGVGWSLMITCHQCLNSELDIIIVTIPGTIKCFSQKAMSIWNKSKIDLKDRIGIFGANRLYYVWFGNNK